MHCDEAERGKWMGIGRTAHPWVLRVRHIGIYSNEGVAAIFIPIDGKNRRMGDLWRTGGNEKTRMRRLCMDLQHFNLLNLLKEGSKMHGASF